MTTLVLKCHLNSVGILSMYRGLPIYTYSMCTTYFECYSPSSRVFFSIIIVFVKIYDCITKYSLGRRLHQQVCRGECLIHTTSCSCSNLLTNIPCVVNILQPTCYILVVYISEWSTCRNSICIYLYKYIYFFSWTVRRFVTAVKCGRFHALYCVIC